MENSIIENKRILIVEDNDELLQLYCTILRKYGAIVTTASDGQQAFAIGSTNKFDLILMDYELPFLNGLEAAIKLKEHGQQAEVVFLSAHAFAEFKNKCLKNGFKTFLSKPIRINELILNISIKLNDQINQQINEQI